MNNITYHGKYRSRYSNESVIIPSIGRRIVMVLTIAILILSIIITDNNGNGSINNLREKTIPE